MSMKMIAVTQKIEWLAANLRLVYRLASGYYHSVVSSEIELAGITERDHVLCIGGGICPFTAILLHQTTGAAVTVIDNDSRCVAKAAKVVERLGLGERISLSCRDGASCDIDFSKFSVVHFAMQVFPMEDVVSKVEQRVRPGTKLIIRRPKKCVSSLYCRLSRSLLRHCISVACAEHDKSRNIGSSLLYVKQRAAV